MDDSKSELKSELKTISVVLDLIKENPKITIPLIIEKTNKSRTTIQKCIKALKEEKLIARIGGKNGGYWEIL